MFRLLATVILLGTLVLFGCRQQQEPPTARVVASEAYRSYFGEPPTVAEGVCYALVGFYPLADDPTQFRPVPHFTFATQGRPQMLLQQVMFGPEAFGMDDFLINPFPENASLREVSVSDGLATAYFSPELMQVRSDLQQAMLAAIGHTLLQFEEIERVQVMVGGQIPPLFPEGDISLQGTEVVDPGPPVLLQALLHEDSDAIPGEMLVFFDRPVEVRSFVMEFPQGEAVQGDYFTSVFDMAVVVHPADPGRIRPGDEVYLSWNIVDGKGRESWGDGLWPLALLSHD
ncbi:GerMN domain-containing protein [Geoalkalibacter halelectricus]|uniref:GerMN domain-containing protein n=1 Tax=Geoalkalibacter halelectricus TaxID=2847045 RepID=UPI003D1FEAEE